MDDALVTIQTKIYTIRNTQVMLDKDIALFFDVKPIRLREQVKRNIERFPEDFMFQLTEEEADYMVSQNAIPSKQHLGGTMPFVFTEQGVAAISAVLTGEKAVSVSIAIMRAFVSMRKFILNNAQIFQRIEKIEHRQTNTETKLEAILTALESKEIQPKQGIFFDGEIFDAYAFVSGIIKKAKKSIYLIDNYIDETVLIMLSKNTNKPDIKIYLKDISNQIKLDIKKYEAQFGKVELVEFNNSHDRFLIIDEEEIYHFGASLKDLGKKWFAFSKMDKESLKIMERLG